MATADVIAVSISVNSSAPKAVAFDNVMIVAKSPVVGGRSYSISPAGLAEMVTDGFATYSRAYQMVNRMSGQSGGAGTCYVFGRTTQHQQTLDFTVDITKTAVGKVLTFDISYQGVTSTITVTVVTNTVDAILDLIEAAIDASLAGLAGIGVAPDNATATKLTFTPDTTGDFVQVDMFGAQWASLEDVSVDGSLAAQLTAAKAAADLDEVPVYGLLIDSYAETEINLAAAFTEAQTMVFLGLSPDQEILESGQTDDVASDLEGAGYDRSAVCFTRNMTSDWAAGLLGLMLGQTPGSTTWHMRQIAGARGDQLTSTHFSAARAKSAFLYTREPNGTHTWDGKAAGGQFFDITHGVDFLKADIESRVYAVMLNLPKVPFNAAGFAAIEAAIRGALGNAQTELRLIEPDWTVTMPSLTGYSAVDKANRLLRTVRFTATLTGAVHKTTVAGVLNI